MSPEEKATVLAHTQFTARHFIAFRGSAEKLVELIAYSIGRDAPERGRILQFLSREDTQKQLETEYETAVYRSNDRNKSWRLICLATTADPEVAKRLLSKRPPNSNSCCFCWQQENPATDRLFPERDVAGAVVNGVYLHLRCVRPWKLLRDLVARSNSK